MKNGEAPITADQGSAPADAATPENAAAAMAPTEQPTYGRLNAAEQAALAAAGAEATVSSDAEAAFVPAAAEAQAEVLAKADPIKKKEDEDAESEEELVDLAMVSESEMFDAIAAADGAREVSGEEGEASALGGDSGGAPIIAVLAVAAAGAGLYFALDSGDDDDLDFEPEPEPEPEPNAAPVFTSEAEVAVDENIDADTVVLDVDATDADGDEVTFSILDEGDDAAAFEIDPETGEVRFIASPDFEAQESYSFTIVATDSEGNATNQDVTVTINDLDENAAPVITSAAAVDIDENVDVDTVVLDVDATDADGDDIVFSILDEGDDAAAFEIDPATGEVRFVASPDFEAQESYSFTVVATDSEGNATNQDVVVTVNDVDDDLTVVSLDDIDNDNNSLTPNLVDASGDDFFFTDDAEVASSTIILNFEEGDTIEFSEGAEVSYTTGADDPNDLEITVNDGGVVSIILLDDVLADDAGFIFDEATAEEAVGFDFISVAEPMAVVTAEETFA